MSSASQTLNGKIAIITGASSGIGAATAIEFARHGYKLSLFAKKGPLDDAGLNETLNNCLKTNLALSPADVLITSGDLSIEDDCKNFVEKTIEHFKQLDVLVANAGINGVGNVQTVLMEDHDRIMNTNSRAVLIMLKLCIPHLISTKGSIVVTSSILGFRPEPQSVSYCMSKGALEQLIRCAALELAPKGVRVNAVNPGWVKSRIDITAGIMTEEEYKKLMTENTEKLNPLGRMGQPEEVAKLIAFLASNESSGFMTGSSVVIDGGHSIVTI